MRWPENKEFAFTIFDDTDGAVLEEVSLVYRFLTELGFRTTKSVWVLRAAGAAFHPGATCEDSDYLAWLKQIKATGFELGLHNVSAGSSTRDRIEKGLDLFCHHFGHLPYIHANHSSALENIYWGLKRFSDPLVRSIYHALTIRKNRRFHGDEEGSPYFWGDLCKETIRYVRNLVFKEINTLQMCPEMPYYDPQRPYVNLWFASSDGGDVERFIHTLGSIDDLQRERGACIIYAHFANGFVSNGRLDPRFIRVMKDVSERPGWFVPVSQLLDWLKNNRPSTEQTISKPSLVRMERRWLLQRIMAGGTH
ncbi:MAG: hypothetical protein KGL31_06235 [candidate division NC10 bacterium]|nr:hypothetical protein [candidate division NC10 bacterium]MDE2321503.1 hypothetical protein [candidate division NC10 bacterium]